MDTVKMIIGDEVTEIATSSTPCHRLTTTGQFVLQTADGEDLVGSCVSFCVSLTEEEPTKQNIRLTKEWKDLPLVNDPKIVFLRNVVTPNAPLDKEETDHSIEVVTDGQKVPFLIGLDQWQMFHLQPGTTLAARSRSTSRLLMIVMPK